MVPLNDQVRAFWEQEPCGTNAAVVQDAPALSREWFERVENHRYHLEPFIHSEVQFTRHRGKTMLEVGVGAGTDHLQFARAGCVCHGVDLTDAAIETTRQRLALYGLESKLQRVDAEQLPFHNNTFDLVYSWGVIHHSEKPRQIIDEIHRVLKPGGIFVGMLYGRRSWVVLKLWVRYALLMGKPWRSFRDVVWNHMESVGTKSYSVKECRQLFELFRSTKVEPIITSYDGDYLPKYLLRIVPGTWGWFLVIHAQK